MKEIKSKNYEDKSGDKKEKSKNIYKIYDKEEKEEKDKSKNDDEVEVVHVNDSLEEHKLEIKIAKDKLGIYPMELWHIRESYFGDEPIENITDFDHLNDPKHTGVRAEAALTFLHKELNFNCDDIKIYYAQNGLGPFQKIMWIKTNEVSVHTIYQHDARYKNHDIQLITFIPSFLYQKKRNLDTILRLACSKEPKLRTQIRLGSHDLELFTKFTHEPNWVLTNYGDLSINGPVSPPMGQGTSNPPAPSAAKRKSCSSPNVLKKMKL